jgi:hypothetical protein
VKVRRVLVLLLALAAVLPATAGAQTVDPRIVNGATTADGDYPWTVALVTHSNPGTTDFRNRQFCGGSLIAPDLVVTAAHCTVASNPASLEVIAGTNDLNPVSAGDRFNVSQIYVHPYAETRSDHTPVPRRDASLLKLAAPVPGAEKLIPVGTAAEAAAASDLVATGWGYIDGVAKSRPDVMKVAALDPVSDAACAAAWKLDFSASEMTCALGSTPGGDVIDTCNGDSGGPLAVPGAAITDGSDWRLIGATSYGSAGCNDATTPGVYTRLTAPLIRPFAVAFADVDTGNDPLPQPFASSVSAVLTGTPDVGQTVGCATAVGSTWANGPVDVEPVIRAKSSAGVSIRAVGTTYKVRSTDAGVQLQCLLRAYASGAGGYGSASSAFSDPVPAPEPEAPPVDPAPPATTEPPPAGEVPVVPGPVAPADTAAPRTTSMRRSCNRRTRVCSLVVLTTDAVPSAGVKALTVALTSKTTRRCGKRRAKRCSVTRTRAVKAGAPLGGGRFSFKLPKLAAGVHTLLVLAIDGAGNVQPAATKMTFRVR